MNLKLLVRRAEKIKPYPNFARTFFLVLNCQRMIALQSDRRRTIYSVIFFFLSELQKQINKVFVTNYNLGLPDGLKETVRQERETIS